MGYYNVTVLDTVLKAFCVEAKNKKEAIKKVNDGLIEPYDEKIDERFDEIPCGKITLNSKNEKSIKYLVNTTNTDSIDYIEEE